MKKVITVCPYCAAGCRSGWSLRRKKSFVPKRQWENQPGTLCLKGYYGWDFINDTQILTRA
jgi:formate dehydrogenase major subunit